jgi:hypothetical protein
MVFGVIPERLVHFNNHQKSQSKGIKEHQLKVIILLNLEYQPKV